MSTSDNQYSGGISFHSPDLVLGAANNTTLTGGFNFDLPLATVAAMTNDALAFTSASNSAAQAQFSNTFTTAGRNYLDTQHGAADVVNASQDRLAASNKAVMSNPNAVKSFTMNDIAPFYQKPGDLPTLNQPLPIAEYQRQQQQQQLNYGYAAPGYGANVAAAASASAAPASGGGSSGVNWGSIIGTVASFFL